MSMSSSCCINPLPSSPPHDHGSIPSLPSKTSLLPRKLDDERSRKSNKRVMATIACAIIIGLEAYDLTSNTNYSIASEMTQMDTKLLNKSNNKRRIARWSDKRICQPWHINSLETIVPENLPRPTFARKHWEGVSNSAVKSAPLVKFEAGSRSSSCFTM